MGEGEILGDVLVRRIELLVAWHIAARRAEDDGDLRVVPQSIPLPHQSSPSHPFNNPFPGQGGTTLKIPIAIETLSHIVASSE